MPPSHIRYVQPGREDLAAAANLLARALACDAGSEREILWDLCEALLSAGDTARARPFVERFALNAREDAGARARTQVIEVQLANLSGSGHPAELVMALAARDSDAGVPGR